MIHEIKTVEDVKTFFNDLLAESLNFQPHLQKILTDNYTNLISLSR